MALVLKDRVRESSTSSGTGSITLAGAFTGYQTFATAVTSGSTVYYTIHNTTSPNDGEWEVGVGTFTSPATLSRDTVFSSSTGGAKVSFSGSSTLEVFITQPAEQAVYINDATGKVEVFGNGTNTVAFTNVTADLFTGNGVALTAINASNISSGTLSAQYGGTGLANLTAENVILGNGASTVKVVAPGTANNVLTSNGSTWISQAPTGGGVTSITAGTGLTGGTITTSGTIAIDSTVTTNSGTQTLTNKRVNPRVVAAGSTSGTLTPNGDTTDVFNAFGLTGAITVDTPSGTPVDGQKLMLRFEDNGTGRGITWTGTSGAYRAVGVTLPTTTVASKVTYVGCVYNSTDVFWDVIAVATQA